MKNHCIVTGAAGFIGNHLCRSLLAKNLSVTGFDNFSTGRRENLDGISGDWRFVEGDLRNAAAVVNLFSGAENLVFHLAALPSVQRSVEDPSSSWEVNVGGTFNLLAAAKKAKAKRVVFASSSSVYGNLPGYPKSESAPLQPLSPYAASKMAGEALMQAWAFSQQLETVCTRFFNVFGPKQDPSNQYSAVIPKFITALMQGKAPTIFGDGEQSRDFTYVDNVLHGLWLAATTPNISGELFNISCGDTHSVNKLAKTLNQIMKLNINPVYAPERSGEVRDSYADISKAKSRLGYAPSIDFQEGLKKTLGYFQSQK